MWCRVIYLRDGPYSGLPRLVASMASAINFQDGHFSSCQISKSSGPGRAVAGKVGALMTTDQGLAKNEGANEGLGSPLNSVLAYFFNVLPRISLASIRDQDQKI